ncbi:putative mediator of RNA polymerase II transcription subunit 26 isoform X2 [Armigeres subalbatus]|uniref:putative mediator of RNA polymerase II transcription subunit 26 isoform X2 n=1 Tax=Armigeres subalbatus TaxID=124917 RepID=UPI002ED588D0
MMELTVLVSLSALQTAAANKEKKPEKRPTKKASSKKPTKTPKSIVEEFTGLPPEDIDFIKELDKQFNEAGGNKLKIKVQRDNSSDTRSSKRTIDGELGYGHYSNQYGGGYHFSKQKYMLYPYAQHNGHLKATHSTEETVTELEITPSHSYELKPIEEVYQVYPDGHYQQTTRDQQYYGQQQQHHQQQDDDIPTIVLKIPGPAKYAQHLQSLLQQYLEVRAAQLYKEFQEQEYQHQQQVIAQQQQLLVQQQQQHQHYQQQHHGHQHQVYQAHPTKYSQPDPYQTEEVYLTGHGKFLPVNGHYYESPRNRPTQPSYHKPVVTPTHIAYHSSPEPDHQAYEYETYHQHHPVAQQQHQQIQYQYVHQQAPTAHEEQQEQYVYQKPAVNFVTPTPDHDDPEEHYHQQIPPKYQNFAQYHAQHKPQQHEPEEYLPEPKLVENYPSDKHTRVIYKGQSLKAQLQQASEDHPEYTAQHQVTEQSEEHDHQQQYVYQAVYPSQTPYLENKAFIEPVTAEAINDLHNHGSSPAPEIESSYNAEQIVAITQKPKSLYNYHANTPRSNSGHRMHATRSAGSGGSSKSSSNRSSPLSSSSSSSSKASIKRDAPYTEEQFKKVNKMIHRMKKKTHILDTTTARSEANTKNSK